MNNYVVVRQPNDHIVLGVNEDYVIEIPMEEREMMYNLFVLKSVY